MGWELNKESAEAPDSDAGDFAASLSSQLWSSDNGGASVAAARTSQDSTVPLTVLALNDSSEKQESKTESQLAKSRDVSEKPKDLAEANTFLLKAAQDSESKSIYKLPSWSRLPKPSPDLGCVSSFSSSYREALKAAGIIDSIDSKEFRNFYQVNMDELNKVMGVSKKNPQEQLLRKIDPAEVKEGDVLEALNPGTFKRHMGIVGPIENGQRVVYNNFGGVWRKEGINDRFGQYKEWNYYRAYLPPKTAK